MSETSPLAEHYISEPDYLEGEKLSEIRHEYIDGEVYAMAGSSRRHNRIGGNLYIAFSHASRNTPCEVFNSDLKVRIDSRKSYYYPDVLVTCDDDDNNKDEYYIDKPCLIVKVLSKSTQQKDYREKLLAYQTISSLQNYLIVAQDKCHIDLFYREIGSDWWIKTFNSMKERIKFSYPECEISVTDIYAGIKFE